MVAACCLCHLLPLNSHQRVMRDYVYPSVFFAYFFFFLLLCGALYFFFRTLRDGYWGRDAEEAKYRMLEEEDDLLSAPVIGRATMPIQKEECRKP